MIFPGLAAASVTAGAAPGADPAASLEMPSHETAGPGSAAVSEASRHGPDGSAAASERTSGGIEIVAAGQGGYAPAPRHWRPPEDSASGLRLDHRDREPLDLDWARRQVRLNRLDRSEPSRVVAFVQLVNRAFLTAGFVN